MSGGLHSRNLLFHIKSYRIFLSVKDRWPSGYAEEVRDGFPAGHGAFTLLKTTYFVENWILC